jgi:NAD/NADP transhydrogenase beta subunit
VAGQDEWLLGSSRWSALPRCSESCSCLPIGGADMPVVISLLNAFTGLGRLRDRIRVALNVLIVSGMLVGASGRC